MIVTNDLIKSRPATLTPYERMRWQQENCTEDIIGYAVGLASDKTERAAYMTGEGTQLTNSESKAAVFAKPVASALMNRFLDSPHWLAKHQYKIAFLVPVSEKLPLGMCTFGGY
jgi:hypothetical protein